MGELATDPNREWHGRGRFFDRASRDYATARPGYPDEVYRMLAERCGLGPGSRVLEIGAGAGQATLPILRTGAHVTAVEPGEALAAELRGRAEGLDLDVIVSRFEDAVVPEEEFDLVVCATAFHWLESESALAKCALALRDGGWLALWWNIFGDDDRPDPFHHAIQPVIAAKAPQLRTEGNRFMPYALDVNARNAEIESTGAFGPVHHEVIRWEGRHDPVGLRRMFGTFSNWLALPDELREGILDELERIAREEFGGLVVRPYQTSIYLARRRTRSP